jgi:hypothetical protein
LQETNGHISQYLPIFTGVKPAPKFCKTEVFLRAATFCLKQGWVGSRKRPCVHAHSYKVFFVCRQQTQGLPGGGSAANIASKRANRPQRKHDKKEGFFHAAKLQKADSFYVALVTIGRINYETQK